MVRAIVDAWVNDSEDQTATAEQEATNAVLGYLRSMADPAG